MEAASEGAVDFLAMVADLEAESERRDADSKMSVEAQTAAMDATRAQADAHGDSAKVSGEYGLTATVKRQFERFLDGHGERLGFDPEVGPTESLIEGFVDYMASSAGRQRFSSVGRVGQCDRYFEVNLPTYLFKVFPMMKLVGWTGLSKGEQKAKAEPLRDAMAAYWKRVKCSRTDMTVLGAKMAKTKWCDGLYFLAQDHWIGRAEAGYVSHC